MENQLDIENVNGKVELEYRCFSSVVDEKVLQLRVEPYDESNKWITTWLYKEDIEKLRDYLNKLEL